MASPSESFPPLQCFGTMDPLDESPNIMEENVIKAITVGYRHFDTAEDYSTLEYVGKAFERAINTNLVTRDGLFITSKLRGLPCGDSKAIFSRMKDILKLLKLKYIDLLLIHWPGPQEINMKQDSPDTVQEKSSFTWFQANLGSAWENMLKLKREGYVKHIGTSNFYKYHLEELLQRFPPEDKPLVNQIYIDLCHPEKELVEFLNANSILVMAYRSLAFLNVYGLVPELNDTITEWQGTFNNKYSIQELVLSWLYKQNIIVVSSSGNVAHIESNFNAINIEVEGTKFIDFFEGNEMINLIGGIDEYAKAFKLSGQK